MTTIIVVRHGQSMANLDDLFAGHTDTPLSPLGQRQAHMTAEYILKNYKIDSIYSSDLKRAYSTAKPVADALSMQIKTDEGLREIYGGEWEEMPFKKLAEVYPAEFNVWCNDTGNAVCPGGESVSALLARTEKALEKIVSENEGKTVLVTTHATVVKVLQCLFRNIPLSDMRSIPWVPNASVTEIKYSGGKYTLEKEGFQEHLVGFTSELPEDI